MRKIIHVDMDAFYAAVEQRDHPALRGRAIAVGGPPEKRGVVATASYEARRFGVHSAMSSRVARQACPELIFVPPRFEVYRAVSQQIHAIFARFTDWVEPLALDEAYLDVTVNHPGIPSAVWVAEAIRHSIWQETGLTASAGVSVNKFLAKVASGVNKPDGLCLVGPEQAEAFVAALPIQQFHGVGRVTAAKMTQLGIHTGADLRQWSEADLIAQFGKVGSHYFQIARGVDERPVEPNRVRKSVGVETTFVEDLTAATALDVALADLVADLVERLEPRQITGRTVTLKVKFGDYQQVTRSCTVAQAVGQDGEAILAIGRSLWQRVAWQGRSVRLLGIGLGNLQGPAETPEKPSEGMQRQVQRPTQRPAQRHMGAYEQLVIPYECAQ
jgi:DNA polymerase IV